MGYVRVTHSTLGRAGRILGTWGRPRGYTSNDRMKKPYCMLVKGSFMEDHGGNSELRKVTVLTGSKIIVSSWHVPQEIMKSSSHKPKDHYVQLACAFHFVQLACAPQENEVTFSLL